MDSKGLLFRYFTEGVVSPFLGETIGMEVETQFVDGCGRPISLEISQMIMTELGVRYHKQWSLKWSTAGGREYGIVNEVVSREGDRVMYELGRHNLEVAAAPVSEGAVVARMRYILDQLYGVARRFDAFPVFEPVVVLDEDVLVIPDERDVSWLELDGREALNLLAGCSAVQFTLSVSPCEAISCLNRLGESIGAFLADYPQDVLWKRYIEESRAHYHSLRYGGPLLFDSLEDYCGRLSGQPLVMGDRLVPIHLPLGVRDAYALSLSEVPLFLRSVWWHFRLRRYTDRLCIEVRPLPRRGDDLLQDQLDFVMGILGD